MGSEEVNQLDDVIKEMQWWMRIKPDLPSVCGRAIEAMNEQKELLIKKQKEIDRLKAEQPKKGHWEKAKHANDRWHSCSVCGVTIERLDHNGFKLICNYCPVCGADMSKDGGQE